MKALRLTEIHRLPVDIVESRCVTMERESPYYPSWILHADDRCAPFFMEDSERCRDKGELCREDGIARYELVISF